MDENRAGNKSSWMKGIGVFSLFHVSDLISFLLPSSATPINTPRTFLDFMQFMLPWK